MVYLSINTHQCGLTNKMHCADGSGSSISLPMWINGHRLERHHSIWDDSLGKNKMGKVIQNRNTLDSLTQALSWE